MTKISTYEGGIVKMKAQIKREKNEHGLKAYTLQIRQSIQSYVKRGTKPIAMVHALNFPFSFVWRFTALLNVKVFSW